ncbi:MAG TPA: PAS domain-containing protein, partial [Gemmatimonadales bacterium]|nr:PAS domain-containing protein [Gemmatimonadales bacterium]
EIARAALQRGERYFEAEYRYVWPDQSVRWLLTRAEMHLGSDGQPHTIVGVVLDITERKGSQEALIRSEQRLRLAQSAGGIGTWEWDLESGSLYWSDSTYHLHGMDPSRPASLEAWSAGIHPDDRAGVDAAMREALESCAERWSTEFRFIRQSDGAVRWIAGRGEIVRDRETGRALRVLGVGLDITEHRLAEAAARDSEARLREALEAGDMGNWNIDLTTGVVVRDQRMLDLCGLPPSAAVAQRSGFDSLIHPDDRKLRDAAWERALQGGEFRTEVRIRRADTGEERWLAARGRVIEATSDQPRRLVGVAYDISERKLAEQRQQLLMREVDHRAKNVLAVVQSLVNLSDRSDPDRFAEAVQGRVSALARAHVLLSRERWVGAALNDIVQHELEAYQGERRILLDGPPVQIEPEAVQPLSMVFHELATNASKYGALSRLAGRLHVSWRVETKGAEQRLVMNWVERGGPPVAGEPERRGFGSMLLTSTVESQLSGEIKKRWERAGVTCELSVGPGLFRLSQPVGAVMGNGAASSDPDEALGEIPGRRCRVLVVEDEMIIALDLKRMLTRMGCELVGPATTFEAARELADREAGHLDAALLDLNLRGVSSLPLADRLTAAGVPVLLVTGYGERLPGIGSGQNVLSKPFHEKELRSALARVLMKSSA